MKNILKKFLAWMKCENIGTEFGIPASKAFKYSELIKMFPLREKINDSDILQLSHKTGCGYKTCYITVKQLKDALRPGGKKN